MSSMRARCGGLLVALAAGVVACREPSGEPAPLRPRVVPARVLPVPTTVSPELQKVIAAPVRRVTHARTADEWCALRRESDEEVATEARALSRITGVTVTPTSIGGVRAFLVEPSEVAPRQTRRLLVHLHGGAYVFNGGEAGTAEAVVAAHFGKIAVLSVDYRVAPEHPFPAALDDAVAVWRAVIEKHEPARIALFGTSAGGGLTMATVLRLREMGLSLPGALFLDTPWTDLSKTGDTYFLNAGVDNTLDTYDGGLESAAKLYAGRRPLTDPLISPVYGDLRGFPPTILISGTRDLLLSCTIRVHRKLREAGVVADLHVYEGQSHAQYGTSHPSPESADALGEIARFFDRHLEQ